MPEIEWLEGLVAEANNKTLVPLPDHVKSVRVPCVMKLSQRFLARYGIAVAAANEKLTLGVFIEDLVESYFRRRGLQLGLVKIPKK